MTCECLKGLVLLRSICDTREGCQVYLDDLPNIGYEAFANWTNSEKRTVSELYTSVEQMAISSLSNRIKRELTKKLGKLKSNDTIVSGHFLAPAETIANANQFCGKFIRTGQSRGLEVRVDSVKLYSATSVSSAIYIYDMDTHKLLATKSFTNQSGIFTVPVNETYRSDRGIFIAYDQRAVTSYKAKEYNGCGCNSSRCFECANCGDTCFCVSIPAAFNPASTSLPLTSDCLCSSNFCGLIATYSIRCSFEQMLCDNKDILVDLLRLEIARTFWNDNRITKAVNAYTLVSNEDRTAILDYIKDEIEAAMPDAIMHFDADKSCFDCKANHYKTMIP